MRHCDPNEGRYGELVNFVFGQFELDASTYKLRHAGREVPLQPKIFDAIRYLVQNRDRVVRKEELLDALWPGQHVNETAVPWTISRARKVLGQGDSANCPIETVRGRGYRFTGEVREVSGDAPSEAPAAPAADMPGLGPNLEPTASSFVTQFPRSASKPPSPRAQSDPFVGRAEVMERLFGALHGASTGRGRLCLLTGEAGIGKTRCINEFAIVARRLKRSVWSGRCLEGGRTAVFWPWVQVLGDALAQGVTSPALQLEIRALIAELTPRGSAAESLVDVTAHATPRRSQDLDVGASSAVAARFWMLEKLSRLLLSCAESAPRVVLLDDVQWADEASLDLLVFLAAELPRVAALVVATARDAVSPNSEAWSKALSRLGPCERIELSGLKRTDVEQYVSEVTGLEFPPEIPGTVHSKCGGNPLFLQETVRLLTACCERDGVHSLRTDDITVPEVARDVLRGRLTGLASATCEALEVACVIGQEFELPVLQSALGVGAEALLLGVDEAVRARLIAPRSRGGSYRFTHDTIRESLYEELPTARRADLHGRVALVLEERAVADFRVNELAYHYYRALPRAEPARVERYARMAGEAAMRGFAYEDAAQFYGWALEAQRFRQDADARSSCHLLLALATAQRLSGRVLDSRNAVERAIAIARQNSFADVLSEAARKLRPTVSIALMPDELALHALEDASRLLSEDQRSLRIRVLGQLACIPPYSLSIEKSRELSGQAVKLARESTDTTDLVEALKNRLHALSGPDDIDELLEVTSEIARLHPQSIHDIGWPRYHALLHKGDMAAAQGQLEEIGDVSRALRRREGLWHCERMRAQQAFHAGDFEKAESDFRELFVQSRRLRLPYGKLYYMVHTMALAQERTILAALPFSPREWRSELEWATSLSTFRAHEARFLLELNRTDDARRAFEEIAHLGFESITRDLGFLNALANLSLVAVALDDRRRAESLYALMRPYPNHNTPNGFGLYLGSVSYFLGQAARFLGKTEEAAAHFEDALAMNGRLGFLPQLARTQLALAELLVDGGGAPGGLRANALLDEAAATARRLEMAPVVSQVDRLRSQLAVTSSRSLAR
jgi:DNA-binding winged helix-turn-helix (wHTH) protein/tetratricopeptide (TPR) repeat protein